MTWRCLEAEPKNNHRSVLQPTEQVIVVNFPVNFLINFHAPFNEYQWSLVYNFGVYTQLHALCLRVNDVSKRVGIAGTSPPLSGRNFSKNRKNEGRKRHFPLGLSTCLPVGILATFLPKVTIFYCFKYSVICINCAVKLKLRCAVHIAVSN
jgi:hypothetical protein